MSPTEYEHKECIRVYLFSVISSIIRALIPHQLINYFLKSISHYERVHNTKHVMNLVTAL